MHLLLGEQLELLCTHVSKEALLVAPFIKEHVLKRLLENISSEIKVVVITRWHPLEIQSGVSDLDVWELIKEHPNSSLLLCSHLHAKYFRFDDRCFVGSANLTGRALGWSKRANLELLIEADYTLNSLHEFEQTLFASSTIVNDFIYKQTKDAVEALPKLQALDAIETASSIEEPSELGNNSAVFQMPTYWLPTTRHPETLFKAYCGKVENLTRASRESTESDLQFLELPIGLSSEAFDLYVGAILLQSPLISRIDTFLKTPQRFGAVRDFLLSLPCADAPDFDASYVWQTLIRWFAHFLPGRYAKIKAPYSEVYVRS